MRELLNYACLEDYCNAVWTTHRPGRTCPECGSPEIEVEYAEVDAYTDFSGR